MADIVHKLPMHASLDDVWSSLEHAGLPAPAREGIVELRLGKAVVARMRLVVREERSRVAWRCVEGPEDWLGTDVVVDLAADGEETVVSLRHRNWREANDFMGTCTTRWASLLFGLKAKVEVPEAEDLWM